MADRQMVLGAHIQGDGGHPAAWRHPKSTPELITSFREKARLAAVAEEAKLDFVFFADPLAVQVEDPLALPYVSGTSILEPMTLLSAIAVVTDRIGLVCTASTTYNEPYHVARKFASLDHISNGRAGWNVVTSIRDAEARNLGRPAHLGHEERYQRAQEFVEVVFQLWEGWAHGAFVRDKESGLYLDVEKMRVVDYKKNHFDIHGIINIDRAPQGRPVITQAGSSEPGRDLAARTADAIFASVSDYDEARDYYRDVKRRMAGYGRSEDDLKILPGVVAIVGETDAEAQAHHEELQSLLNLDVALSALGKWMLGGVDLTTYPLDGPLPELPVTNQSRSMQEEVVRTAKREGLTIRQLAQKLAVGRQFLTVIGSPTTVADEFEKRFVGRAADGFILLPACLPTGHENFCRLLVPELQRRGLFRSDYAGTTLRDHMGLHQPPALTN